MFSPVTVDRLAQKVADGVFENLCYFDVAGSLPFRNVYDLDPCLRAVVGLVAQASDKINQAGKFSGRPMV